MIGVLIQIIILLIIVGVFWWGVQQLLPLVPLPDPFRRVIYVLIVVVLVLIVLYVLLGLLNAVPGFRMF
jgi:VIT1/CCC1 family predicted Fe2+/Mn2+ transporter